MYEMILFQNRQLIQEDSKTQHSNREVCNYFELPQTNQLQYIPNFYNIFFYIQKSWLTPKLVFQKKRRVLAQIKKLNLENDLNQTVKNSFFKRH